MYCSINDAYGSNISESENSESSSYMRHNPSIKFNKSKQVDHRYYIEQFEKFKNSTDNTLTDNFAIMNFNNVSDHISSCESCRLYLNKKTKKTNTNKFMFELKELILPIFIGLFIILIIELINRVK